MGLSFTTILIMAIGSFLAGIFIILMLIGIKYDDLLAPLNSKEYPLYQLYGVGFAITNITKHKFGTKTERKRKQCISLLIGENHAEYYLRVNAAQRYTISFLVFVMGFGFYALSNSMVMILVFIMFSGTAFYYIGTIPQNTLVKKTDKVLSDFADVVSKLALLVNAGMIMKEAWEKVAFTNNGEIYMEMRNVIADINNGVPEVDAYTQFATRCTSPEIKKFTSTIIQGLVKGNKELVEMIKQQSREMWDSKRYRVKQQGEKAASKLLIPICIMFIGILVMIIVPIFANLGV